MKEIWNFTEAKLFLQKTCSRLFSTVH